MDTQFIVVFITVPTPEIGRQIAVALLQQNLAACVNIIPMINSLYLWEGKINDDEEQLLVVKTRAEIFESHLIPVVQAIHPYQIPELIALPIVRGSSAYLEWMGAVTTPK